MACRVGQPAIQNPRDASMRTPDRFFTVRPAEKFPPVALVLNEHGIIRDCCQGGEQLFGYRCSELLKLHVSILLPQLAGVPLLQDGIFNPRLDFLCHCGHRFVAQDKEGHSFYSELHFVHLQHGARSTIRLIVRPAAPGRFRTGARPHNAEGDGLRRLA